MIKKQRESLEAIEQADQFWHDEHYAKSLKDKAFPLNQIPRYTQNIHASLYDAEWMFSKLVPLATSESVILDFGCGEADFTYMLSQVLKPKKVHAFDLSPQLIERAKQRCQKAGLTNVEFLCSSFSKLPYAKESFDVIFVKGILHHFPPYVPNALEVMNTLLRKGGYLVLCEPILDSPFITHLKNFIPAQTEGTPYEKPLNSKTLLADLKKNFEILDLKFFWILARFNQWIKHPGLKHLLLRTDERLLNLRIGRHFAGEIAVFARKK